MTSEDICEYYGWLSHKFGFFEDWRNRVSDYIKNSQPKEHDSLRNRADFSAKVFHEILLEKINNGEIPEDVIYGLE